MKLFKLMATTAITTMAVAAISVSASAAGITASYSYDSANSVGTVALTGLPESATTQLTLLVLDQNATTVTEGMIKQIDQGTNSEIAAVKVADLSPDAANQTLLNTYNAALATYEADKTAEGAFATIEAAWNTLDAAWKAESAPYYVRVGGTQEAGQYVILADDFTVATTLTKPTKPTAPSTEPEVPDVPSPIEGYYMGDANRDDWVGSDDALEVLKYENGDESELDALYTDEDGETYIFLLVDSNEDEWVGSDDALEILKFENGDPSELDKFYEEF